MREFSIITWGLLFSSMSTTVVITELLGRVHMTRDVSWSLSNQGAGACSTLLSLMRQMRMSMRYVYCISCSGTAQMIWLLIKYRRKKKTMKEAGGRRPSHQLEYNCNAGVDFVDGYFSSSSPLSPCLFTLPSIYSPSLPSPLPTFTSLSPSWVLCLTLIRNSPSDQLKLNCPSFA